MAGSLDPQRAAGKSFFIVVDLDLGCSSSSRDDPLSKPSFASQGCVRRYRREGLAESMLAREMSQSPADEGQGNQRLGDKGMKMTPWFSVPTKTPSGAST